MSKVLLIGATSAIVEATARVFASRRDEMFLIARNDERLDAIASDLELRGAPSVAMLSIDLTQSERHEALVSKVIETMGSIDIAVIGHGVLGKQEQVQSDYRKAREVFDANFLSVASLLTPLADYMESQKRGTIAVISSVAGDRGRMSNYVYGASKAAKSAYLSGLRNRLFHAGVHVVTIKPGFVDTPMTAEFNKGALWASPEQVAKGIVKAIDKKKNVVYLPGFWWPIMMIIKHIPESIFKRLKL